MLCIIILTTFVHPSFADSIFPEGVTFVCHSMPENGAVLAHKQAFSIEGIIRSRKPLESVSITVFNSVGNAEISAIVDTFEDPYEYYLSGDHRPINNKLKFANLTYGDKRIKLTVTVSGKTKALYEASFSVSSWGTLSETLVHGIGLNAMYELYGGSDGFLFNFKVRKLGDRWISIDPQWKKNNLVTIRGVGRNYLVNIHAQEAFENAFEHISNSYVYIEYNNGNSGVFPLSRLVGSSANDGTYAPRFTNNSMSSISHHAFGTAIDINSDLKCNQIRVRKGVDTSWETIEDGINRLSYRGLYAIDGVENVYCFKFDGNRPSGYAPENIRNYLLFELAFYREGFSWGAYFTNKCDAMHFSLTEPNDYNIVYPEDSDSVNDRNPIRMVYIYAEDSPFIATKGEQIPVM